MTFHLKFNNLFA